MSMIKSWTQKQIKQHEIAGQKLSLIKDEFHSYILQNARMSKEITEKKCVEFIKNAYKKHGLANDHKKEFAIVAFGTNTKEVHYFPKAQSQKLKPESLILLDIWARLSSPDGSAYGGQARLDVNDAPYADTTFMFYHGNTIPKEIQKTWEVLTKSRDNAINYIKKEVKKGKLPRGLDIDRMAHDHIGNNKLGHAIKHTIGHSLGFDSPHGKLPGINWREYSPIMKNVGYTIEPGIYLANWGMRTEIDFYINDKNEMIITTPIQSKIEIITPPPLPLS